MDNYIAQVWFAKQQKKPERKGWINGVPVHMGWERFVDWGLDQLQRCLAPIKGKENAGAVRECIHHHNVLGWSIYGPSLQDWLSNFGKHGVLVIFTEDMKVDPAGVIRKVEAHIGLSEFRKYTDLNTTVNARGKYGWQNKDKQGDRASHVRSVSNMEQATYDKLHAFYSPFMTQLQAMAVRGDISPLPRAWVGEWQLEAGSPRRTS